MPDSPTLPAEARWPVTLEVPVAWGDMDAFAHVNNVVYLRWFESARIAYFLAAGMLEERAASGVGPILARSTIDYRRPVTFPDRIAVSTRVVDLRTTSFTMGYRVTSEAHGGAVVAEGDGVIVMVDYRSGAKVPIGDALRGRIAGLERGVNGA